MHQTEHHRLHGICLRLIHALDVKRPEALGLARWVSARSEVFGAVPPVIVMCRRGAILDLQGWTHFARHLAVRLETMAEPSDLALHRLRSIATHLGLSGEKEANRCFLALQQRPGRDLPYGLSGLLSALIPPPTSTRPARLADQTAGNLSNH